MKTPKIIKPLLFGLALGLTNFAFSQSEDKKEETPTWEDNFFMAINTSSYLDIIKTPLRQVRVITGNDMDANGNIIPRYADAPSQSATINFFSLGLEPRYNIKKLNENAAFALALPMSIGIGATSSVDETVLGVTGFGSIQLPLMLKFYLGNGSTYQCEKDYGMSLGGGIEYDKIGLMNVSGESQPIENKGFFIPVASFGIHFWRNNLPVEINIKYGNGAYVEYANDKYGQPLKNEFNQLISQKARSSTFRISYVQLLNY
jgi:hypothetical protein